MNFSVQLRIAAARMRVCQGEVNFLSVLQSPPRKTRTTFKYCVDAIIFPSATTLNGDFQSQQWSEFAKVRCSEAVSNWSHDSKSVYMYCKNGDQSAEVVRISVPDGKVERVLDLKDITLGGYWPYWVSLLSDDSPLLMLDKNAQEIYRLDLQYR